MNPQTSRLKNLREKIILTINTVKSYVTARMFWGRSSLYRNLSLSLMLTLTFVVSISGMVVKLSANTVASDTLTLTDEVTTGQYDLLQQGGSIETVISIDPSIGIELQTYVVQDGDTLESIANDYNVTIDTIRWASQDTLNIFTNEVQAGWELSIPGINGVLYEIKPGDTFASIINTTGGNEFDIKEFNEIESEADLDAGDFIFVPNGNLFRPDVDVSGIPRGVFTNPLSNPDCYGYGFSRGFLSYHNGVDLSRGGGCPISSVANGYIEYAGWTSQGQGYNVIIDHGGGIKTHYYHGNGTFWVQAGERVQQGDPIMYMGTTGNSTGVHLHFSLFKNGVAVDPAPFVPY